MKKTINILLSVVMLFSVAGVAVGAEVLSPSDQNPNVTVGAGETHRNLYTAGGNVIVNGRTAGDLTVAGGMVTVAGNVEQQLLAAAGTLNVSGAIGNTARIAGGNVTVSGSVGGDLVIAGGNVTLAASAPVAGDLLLAGGNASIDAPVSGSARIAGGNVVINSKINGDVRVQAGQSLTFGPSAEVTGTVYYKGPKPAVVQQGAKVSNIQYTEWQRRAPRGILKAVTATAFLVSLLAWMLAAWLLTRFKKSWVHKVHERIERNPWGSFGWGLVYFIVLPVAVVLLAVTVVGYYVAFVLGLAYALLLALAKIFAIVALGLLIMRLLSRPGDNVPLWQPVVLGAVAWALLGLIPIIGWIVMAVVFLQTLGALTQTATGELKE